MNVNDLGFIKAGKIRNSVYRFLDRPTTVSEVASSLSIPQSQVSRAVKELRERGLVKILNPKARKGRLYVAK